MSRYAESAASATLAEVFGRLRPADLPAAVHREASRAFLNILGCTIGGARHPMVALTERALADMFGPAQATVIGRGYRTDRLHAALLNGLSSSVHTFDDTHAQAIVHPSGPVFAAVLAVCEQHSIDGADVLAAFALGVEAVCRISKAISVAPAVGTIAWSQTGIVGGIGAAIASGRLLGLDTLALQRAIGIAACQAGGFRVAHGTMSTPMMAGQGAQTGLRAALLARAGFEGPINALEGRYGYCSVFSESAHLESMLSRLGEHFEILSDTYKPYPCGIVIHPAIEACLRLHQDHRLAADAIAAVDVETCAEAIALTDRRHPKDEMQAHVSLHYWAAMALTRGRAGVAELEAVAVPDPALQALQERIALRLTAGIAPDGVAIVVHLKDGRRLRQTIDHCIGSTGRPMTDAELEAKFRDLSEPVIGAARTQTAIAACQALTSSSDAGALPRALA